VTKIASKPEVVATPTTIKAYLREAIAAAKAGLRIETKPVELPLPEELKAKFSKDPKFKRAFESLTPVTGLSLSLQRRKTVGNADSANREGDGGDFCRARISGAGMGGKAGCGLG
jgi:hypothetical protein